MDICTGFIMITSDTYLQSNIKEDRAGIPFTIDITIQNVNNSCAALAGALVDIWHCDKDGNYSEYGGSGMQATDYRAVHIILIILLLGEAFTHPIL